MSTDTRIPVALIPGDGIGPEVTEATLRLVEAAGGRIAWEPVIAGEAAFASGVASGVPEETLAAIEATGLALKGPLGTPIGHGGKSANVTLRKRFETFANVRPARELPGVTTPFSGRGIDIVVVRENVEDLYAGIEHLQTPDVAQCLKLTSRLGCRRIAVTALELARSQGRRRVTVVTKANIMKLTEGMLLREFEAAAADYPELETDHMLVDNCAHQLVMAPERFDVIVTTNMNGDILSDLTSGLVGGLGFAPSANLGTRVALFEAVHGSAPDIAGMGIANPTALALAAAMLLRHVGQGEAAERLEGGLRAALADGMHTADVAGPNPVGTAAFADAAIARMPTIDVRGAAGGALKLPDISPADARTEPGSREKAGADVFVETGDDVERLAATLRECADGTPYRLAMISNRGTAVWPGGAGQVSCVDHFRCRFLIEDRSTWHADSILGLLERIGRHYRWMHVEKLEILDGEPAYTRAQGER